MLIVSYCETIISKSFFIIEKHGVLWYNIKDIILIFEIKYIYMKLLKEARVYE